MHSLLTGHGPSGPLNVSIYDGAIHAVMRHAGGVRCPATAETGAHWRATTSAWWPPLPHCLIPIHGGRAGRTLPARLLRGSGGGCGCGSALAGQVPQYARDRLIRGHPLLLAGRAAGDLNHALGQVAGADADP